MAPESPKWAIDQLETAIHRLREALDLDPGEQSLFVDGSIQRFEFVFELFWKCLRRCLAHEGIQTGTPREALSEAFRAGWLGGNDTVLNAMILDRNATSHTYNRKTADRIYAALPNYLVAFESALSVLKRRFK